MKIITVIILLTLLLSGCVNETVVVYPVQKTKQALQYAISKEGAPYSWGGDGPKKFDSSGLIICAYKNIDPQYKLKIGEELHPDATMDDIYNYNVVEIPPQKLRPGDIVFITSDKNRVTHGGLFIEWVEKYEEFRFINASSYHEEVTIGTWPVNGTKRDQWFVGAGKIKIVY